MKKIIILGDSSVGKTSLIRRYYENTFDTDYEPTIGVEVKKLDNLLILDSGGHKRIRELISTFYRSCQIFVFVFDLSNRTSFMNMIEWIEYIRSILQHYFQIIIVGTKIDLENMINVHIEEIMNISQKYSAQYVLTSSRTGEGIYKLFLELESIVVKSEIQQVEPVHETCNCYC